MTVGMEDPAYSLLTINSAACSLPQELQEAESPEAVKADFPIMPSNAHRAELLKPLDEQQERIEVGDSSIFDLRIPDIVTILLLKNSEDKLEPFWEKMPQMKGSDKSEQRDALDYSE